MKDQNTFLLWIAGIVSIGGILYGYDIGVISGALLFIRDSIPMTDVQVGWIVGAVLGGGLCGTLIAGPIGDKFGRKPLIIVSALVFLVGIFFILSAYSFLMILSARLLLGTGVGMVSVGVPLYVAEMVPDKDRGKYITFFQLLLTFGILLAYFVDLIFTASENWRGMFAILLIPSVILLIGIIFSPETPRWLLAHNETEKAHKILKKIHNSEFDVEKNIEATLITLKQTSGSWRDFFSRQFIVPATIAVMIAVFNQLTGINSFLQYAPLILKNAGMSTNEISMMGSVGIGGLNFIFTIIAIGLVDSIGRRPLLLIGVFGVMVSEIYLGLVTYFLNGSSYAGVLVLIGLLLFIMFFAIGPGVVVWLAISELFPTKIRGKGIAFCLFFNSLVATALSVYFLPLVKFLGMTQTYWLFASFSGIYFLITLFFLPETKARSLEDIQLSYAVQN